ncbi:MAG TPA: DUF2232 domain-containing protein [Candidatus Binataceae bacterium]|nr:DUF2232 domain-containing protein [Candidatus Binataceae bacterium]
MTLRDLFGMLRACLTSAVMFMAGALVPVLGTIALILAPAPVLGCAVGFRNGLWRAAAVTAAAAGLITLAGGLEAGAAYFATIGVSSVVICFMLERRRPFEQIVAVTAASMLVVGALSVLAFVGSPEALAQGLHNNLLQVMTRTEKLYSVAGLDTALTQDLRIRIVNATVRLMPALTAISAAMMALANLALFWRISGRQQRIGYALFGDLALWSTPEWLIWVLLIAGFGLLIPVSPLSAAALNCSVCIAAIYFCQGLAIMAFYFRVLAMPSFARGLVYIITFVQPVLAILICAAGVFDLWIDFRRLKPSSPETRNASNPL